MKVEEVKNRLLKDKVSLLEAKVQELEQKSAVLDCVRVHAEHLKQTVESQTADLLRKNAWIANKVIEEMPHE
jgi:hypothetical protein